MVEENKEIKNKTLDMKIKAGILTDILHALSVVVSEAQLCIEPDNINCLLVEPAHVCMVSMHLDHAICEEYKATTVDIGVDLTKLSRILTLSNKDELVSLKYDSSIGEYLIVSFGNLTRKMRLIDMEGMNKPKMPDIETSAKAKLLGSEASKSLKAMNLIDTDHFTIKANKDQMVLSAEDALDSVEAVFDKDKLIELSVKAQAKSMYSLEFMDICLKAAKADTELELNFTSDNPIIINYSFADEKVKLKYLVAPRIESE